MIPFLPFKTEQQQLTDLILLLSFKDPCHANPELRFCAGSRNVGDSQW